MKKIEKIRQRLLDYLNKLNFISLKCTGNDNLVELNINSSNLNCVKAVLASSFYPHVIRIDRKNKQLISE